VAENAGAPRFPGGSGRCINIGPAAAKAVRTGLPATLKRSLERVKPAVLPRAKRWGGGCADDVAYACV